MTRPYWALPAGGWYIWNFGAWGWMPPRRPYDWAVDGL